MPNDLSIQAVAAVTGASENPAEPQAASLTPPAHAPPVQTASPSPNPELRLDAALGLVVIEFHDTSGTVTTSIPSQRQLEAYRIWEQSHRHPPDTSTPYPPAEVGATSSGANATPVNPPAAFLSAVAGPPPIGPGTGAREQGSGAVGGAVSAAASDAPADAAVHLSATDRA